MDCLLPENGSWAFIQTSFSFHKFHKHSSSIIFVTQSLEKGFGQVFLKSYISVIMHGFTNYIMLLAVFNILQIFPLQRIIANYCLENSSQREIPMNFHTRFFLVSNMQFHSYSWVTLNALVNQIIRSRVYSLRCKYYSIRSCVL